VSDTMKKLVEITTKMANKGVDLDLELPRYQPQCDSVWRTVMTAGTELWLDTGDLNEATRLWVGEFSALTTNNTLLNNEIQKGIYDHLIKEALGEFKQQLPNLSEKELISEVAFILNAHHGLRLVSQFGCRVSVELHTDLANNVASTIAMGKRLYAICPERFIIKVPMTPAGFVSAQHLAAGGIPINYTLGFSARQNYLAAAFGKVAYANVFMGRLNAFVSDNGLGDGQNVGEKATLATQRALLELRSQKVSETRLIGASMRGPSQIASLAGLDVYTIPTKVADAYQKDPKVRVRPRITNDPVVKLNGGVSFDDFAGNSLWHVPDDFKVVVRALPRESSPQSLIDHFHATGFGDLFPRWTSEELEVISKDGKIGVLEHWKEPMEKRKIGLDALMNMSGLLSFVKDQAQLDDRIKSFV
jgi:transaldolase